MSKDYYESLGVKKGSSQDEIKRAYKESAKKYHPDLNKGDKAKEEKFKEINEAYKVLGDEKARANYDRFGSSEGFQGGPGGFDFRSQGFEDFDFGDIFEGFFGGGGTSQRRRGPRRGATGTRRPYGPVG